MEFTINGETYTKETFCKQFNVAESDFESVYASAKAKGIIKETLTQKSPFDKFMDELNIHNTANAIRDEETWQEQKIREDKTANKCKYDKVKFSFNNIYEAQAFMDMVTNEGIAPDNIIYTTDNKVTVKDITQFEYNKFATWYNTRKATNSIVRGIDKTTTAAANVGKYAAEEVVAPLAKSGIRALGMLAKTCVKTAVKAGSSILSTVVETASETCSDVKNDPEVIKAVDNANKAKNTVINGTGNAIFTKGIEIG